MEAEYAQRAVDMYAAGWAVKDIALELEASHRTVLNWLQRAGIDLKLRDNITR